MKIKTILSYIAIGLLIFLALSSFPNLGIRQQTALYVCVPGIFLLTLFISPLDGSSKSYRFLIYLYLWECVTFWGAEDQQVALDEMKRLAACFMMAFSFFYLAKKEKLIPWLYGAYFVYYVSMLYYANTNILTDEFDYTEDRLRDRVLNSNFLAYMTFFLTFAIYIFPSIVKKEMLKKVFRVLFVLSPLLSFVVAILTGSRQVVIIQLPFIAILFYIRYFRRRHFYIKAIFIIVLCFSAFFLLDKANQIYEQSNLSERMELRLDDDPRTVHFFRALKLGLSHPVLGVGPGNYKLYSYSKRSFSHSTYTETFANNGFVGFILFVLIFYFYLRKEYVLYKKTKDEFFLLLLVFGIFYALDNAFYVMHTAPWLISFFFLIDSQSQTYYRNKYVNKSSYLK